MSLESLQNNCIVPLKADQFLLKSKIWNCELLTFAIDSNTKFLIIKENQIKFDIDGIQTNFKQKLSKKIYSEIYEEISLNSCDTNSIIFILPIEQIVIPKDISTIPILLSISIINYQISYNLTWSQDRIDDQFEIFLDLLDKQNLIHIKVEENFKGNDNLFSKIGRINDECLDIKKNAKDHLSLLNKIWSKLFSKCIVDLKVKDRIKSESILEIFLNFGNGNDEYNSNCLNRLELELSTNQEVDLFLNALNDNYVIKCLRLNTPNRVNANTEKIASEFLSKRIASKISLNSKNNKFKQGYKKLYKLHYPSL